MKEEGAAYLGAVEARDTFFRKLSPKDFVPAGLAAAIQRCETLKNKVETLCERVNDEELQKELAPDRKEIKAYSLVLKNVASLQTEQPDNWDAVCYYLDPDQEMDEPALEKLQQVRKALLRVSGFSDKAKTILQANIARRDAMEKERLLKGNGGGGKTATRKEAPGGFFKKLGFRL